MYGIEQLTGKTLVEINMNDDKTEILFKTHDGEIYKMYHEQDCCELVYIEDICGDLQDLLNSKILLAFEASSNGDEEDGTYTYTFYKLATINGWVDIRWYGSSNGYYSESVEFVKVS